MSKEFKLFEDSCEREVESFMDISPGKSNNKENIPPSTEKEAVEREEFVRPLPREALKKLMGRSEKSEKSEEVVVTEERVVNEEVVITEYFAGVRIMTEKTHKMSVSTTQRTRSNNPDDKQRGIMLVQPQSNIHRAKQLNSIPPLNKSWDFEICHDDPEDLELMEYNTGVDLDMLEEKDKENTDPGIFGSGDELNWQGERQPKNHKRKLVEDWS